MKGLKADDSIIILPADKGRSTVVLNKSDYIEKAQKLLNDESTYSKIKRDPTTQYKKQLVGILQRLEREEAITPTQKKHLYPTSEDTPKFYGLPKIHKAQVPLRPIVSSIGSISYNVAGLVARIIGPLAGKTKYHLKNSVDLVSKMKDLTLDKEEILVSYDVSALFTSVPVDESIQVIKELLESDNTLCQRTTLSTAQVIELLTFCLKTTYFVFNGEFYQQKEGAAMGSPVSPIVANLYMEHFEQTALQSAPHPPRYWGRYVDDTLCVIHRDHLEEFSLHLNSIHPKIQFTREVEENNKLPMLDCCMTRLDNGTIKCSVYRKPTHTDQYLHFNSHHPLQHKLGVIRTLTHRAQTVVTTEEDKNKEMSHIKEALGKCGYQKWVFQVSDNKEKKRMKEVNKDRPRAKGSVVIPYVKGLSETMARIFQSKGIRTHYKPVNSSCPALADHVLLVVMCPDWSVCEMFAHSRVRTAKQYEINRT